MQDPSPRDRHGTVFDGRLNSTDDQIAGKFYFLFIRDQHSRQPAWGNAMELE